MEIRNVCGSANWREVPRGNVAPLPDAVDVSVVIAARDAEATLGATLDGLAAQRGAPPHEVIVVDNGSLDGTAGVAEAHPLRPRVLRRERGDGPGAARNEGARAARA